MWLLLPQREDGRTLPLARSIERLCDDRGWEFQSRPTVLVKTRAGSVGVLATRDAQALYSHAHRATVGVLSIGSAVVSMDPRDPNNQWLQRTCQVFVEYKAFNIGRLELARARDPSPLSPKESERFEAFATWPGMSDCQGLDDPRLLPLHTFDRKIEWASLATDAGRTQFNRLYGRSPRTAGGLMWSRDRAGHGRNAVVVDGIELPIGFHWDVQVAAGPATLITHYEVWTLASRRGRINVYPEAHVRQGEACRRTWPVAR